ncbi:hypothetical protein [Mycobacterium sp. 1245801.1]|uniref:hypothetical protein n=1 Tax=Mycobacterium sp. 1245801.1 TaxID=1834075 RepID=UPI0012EABE17|nr:hypothetical protein [Mycobacterium sp. 1245801.1]
MTAIDSQLDGCSTTPHMEGTIMKAKSTKKTLKAAVAALGVIGAMVLPAGCATTAAGGDGVIGGSGACGSLICL